MSRHRRGQKISLVNNAASPETKPTKREGIVYVSPSGNLFTEPELTPQRIAELSESNIYARGTLNKLLWLLFTGEPEIEIKDRAGNIVPPGTPDKPTVLDNVKTMLDAPDVDLYGNMQRTLCDCYWWGPFIANPVWEYVGNTYTLTSLTRLDPQSFIYPPLDGEIYNPLMKGITLNNGNIEYWFQDSNYNQKKLQYPFVVTPPLSTKLGGSPMIQPLLLAISYLSTGWKAIGQTMNRAGAPSVWLRVTDGDEDTFRYCQEILKNWGKNTSFPLYDNIEAIDPHITEPATPGEAIKMLQNLLIDYFSPVSFLQSGDGGGLFDNSNQKTALLMSFIKGMHTWIEDAYERLLQTYLIANRYDGYSLRITLPMPDIDRTEADQQWVNILANSQRTIVDENEIRRFIPGVEQLDEAGLARLRESSPAGQVAPELIQNAVTLPTSTEQAAYERLAKKADATKAAVLQELRSQGFAV